ncbi:hypothetical protein [Mesotoga sp. Brook.08.YT.4.2.5.1]|uniref:hypothetical protein n=1 Tax=Mesotoga sp. Brook.08.YT.4.2.5.1 TaxID=1421001 RepID=UPI001CA59F05|nr:hypothetical protein [Mesotoga sp. Brook.08.YT.4.2.5.1]
MSSRNGDTHLLSVLRKREELGGEYGLAGMRPKVICALYAICLIKDSLVLKQLLLGSRF